MLLNLTHWTFNVNSDKNEFHHSHVSYCTKVIRSTHRRVWATEPGLTWMSAAGSVIRTVEIVVTMDDWTLLLVWNKVVFELQNGRYRLNGSARFLRSLVSTMGTLTHGSFSFSHIWVARLQLNPEGQQWAMSEQHTAWRCMDADRKRDYHQCYRLKCYSAGYVAWHMWLTFGYWQQP